MNAATIKLFLPLDDPKRLRTAEISNWSGKAVAAPRTDLDPLLEREELLKPRVYVLTGANPNTGKPLCYIGEAEAIWDRLKQHKQIEREFISVRTQEALAQRKAKGLPLGRPKGPAPRHKLDPHREEIVGYLNKGVSKRSVAKIVECSPSTLYDWIKRHKISIRPSRKP